MFKDLDDLKLDYIALDHVYANFYSKIITQRFYATKFIPRKRSYNVALRGFNPDQSTLYGTYSLLLLNNFDFFKSLVFIQLQEFYHNNG
jgi:hypothetical protein